MASQWLVILHPGKVEEHIGPFPSARAAVDWAKENLEPQTWITSVLFNPEDWVDLISEGDEDD